MFTNLMLKSKTMSNEKLQDLASAQKIQIVCAAITYLGGQVEEVTKLPERWSEDRVQREKVLNDGIAALCKVAEDFGNLLNDCDFTCDVDERVTGFAFEIVNDILTQ